MHADEVIESYIDDTVRLLRRRQRDDVAAELHTLLNEELNARAKELGRAPDEDLALSLVRGLGLPTEAAARYQPAWTIIDPADSTSFLRAAIMGAGALLLLGALKRQLPPIRGTANDLVALAILAWLGLLVVAFGVKSGIRRTWPSTALWRPHDRDRANRVGTAVLVPVATLFVIFYGAPKWVFDRVSGGRFDTSWAGYTADFQRFHLPWFIGSMIGLIALLLFVAILGRWHRLTGRINIGLNMALAGLILSFAVNGDIFQSSTVDQIARSVLALVAVSYVPSVAVQLYGEIGRIDRTAITNGA
jgi:hypothetical protein